MGKIRGPYQEEFQQGSIVKIADRLSLQSFFKTWQFHNKLEPEQLDYADQLAEVEAVAFYHGADELYRLRGIPGVWHEQCLGKATK